MKLILSFLGTGKYEQADYPLDGQIYSTPYTQEALSRRYPEYTLKVILTKEANDKHGAALLERVPYKDVPIPSGKSEPELWDIFNALVGAVPEEAELVMDVSHGFRSQPILALAVLQLLQVVKRVRVERILYGFFDSESKRADFFDLTAFLELMEWTQATRDLLDYGNGSRMRQLLKQIHRHSHMVEGPKAKELSSLGKVLEGLGASLELLRLPEALSQSQSLLKNLHTVREDVVHLPRSRPLGLLFERIEERYRPLAQATELLNPEGLKVQSAMMSLLLETGSYAQASALARELMVSWLCLQKGFEPLNEREAAEKLLGSYADAVRKKQSTDEQKNRLGLLWEQISHVRNDIAHAAMRPRPLSGKSLVQQIKKVCGEVQTLISPP